MCMNKKVPLIFAYEEKVMRSVNKVIIVRHLGTDPDVHQFTDGNQVTSLSVATSHHWTDKNGQAKV